MSKFKKDRSFEIMSFAVSLAMAAMAAVTYAFTLADYVFPGDSARLLVQWSGIDRADFPDFPLWGAFVKLFAGAGALQSIAFRTNLLSLACGVFSTFLLCRLLMVFVWHSTTQDDTVKLAKSAALVTGISASVVFVFSTVVWQASTHLEHRIFDVMWALLALRVVTLAIGRPGLSIPVAIVSAAIVATGIVESPVFIPVSIAVLIAFMSVLVKNGRSLYGSVVLHLASVAVFIVAYLKFLASGFIGTDAAATAECSGMFDMFLHYGKDAAHEMRTWFTTPGWLAIVSLAALPAIASVFAAGRGLNNDRRWRQYAFHIAMTFCAILALATPLAPEAIMRPWGVLPVATTALVAIATGYLAAYWYLLARVPLPVMEYNEDGVSLEVRIGKSAAPIIGIALVLTVALTSLVNAVGFGRRSGNFADVCAREIIATLGDRSWFVTDGTLDDHLRVAAAVAGKELNLVCLQRDMSDPYLKELSQLVEERGLSAGGSNLKLALKLGVLPFLQDWFSGDKNAAAKAAVFGVPDFWHMAELEPMPENMFFGGVKNAKSADVGKLAAEFKEFWSRMESVLWTERNREGSRNIAQCDNPVESLRLQLRRHVGFVGNNLGVFLQDAGRDNEAFSIYELVLGTIDPDNVCTLFNEFEMARAGVKCAVEKKLEIERKIKAIVDDPKRRYALWSLSRYYGYIRSPEIFARMGYAWARSGQPGNAIAQVRRAIDFVSADRQAGLLNMMAAIYASGKQMKKSRSVYEQVLATDANNRDALVGLARIAMQEGAAEEAREYLEKAATAAGRDTPGIESALLHMMNNDLDRARMELQKVTDMYPKSLQAWSLLAGVLLQQADQAKNDADRTKTMDELEHAILPKMETISADPRDYFVQMTKALVYMRKGQTFRKQARDALVIAAMSRPDVTIADEMILGIDIELDDGESAERHARMILRRDRHNRLANYVMGSLRLKDGDYSTAETFLRLSLESGDPLAPAQNDLAEVLRRQQKFEEAEKFAREAVKNQPKLYVAWETLGATLLDQNKNLDEAEKCVEKAIQLSKNESSEEDIRMQITLARVQLARGSLGKARSTLRALRKKQSKLSNYDRDRMETLMRSVQGK